MQVVLTSVVDSRCDGEFAGVLNMFKTGEIGTYRASHDLSVPLAFFRYRLHERSNRSYVQRGKNSTE